MNGFCFCTIVEAFQCFLESEISKGRIGSHDVIGMRDIAGCIGDGFRYEFTFTVFNGNVADTLSAEAPGGNFNFLNGNVVGDKENFGVQGFIHILVNALFDIFPFAAGFDPELDELSFVEVGETEEDFHLAAIFHILLEISNHFHAYKLSKLFTKYQSWRAVYAAIYAGEGAVDEWLLDEENLAEDGTLGEIPDDDTEKFVKKFEKTVEIYRELYESAN